MLLLHSVLQGIIILPICNVSEFCSTIGNGETNHEVNKRKQITG